MIIYSWYNVLMEQLYDNWEAKGGICSSGPWITIGLFPKRLFQHPKKIYIYQIYITPYQELRADSVRMHAHLPLAPY